MLIVATLPLHRSPTEDNGGFLATNLAGVSPTIIMVTNVKEGTRIKCQQYWPESGKKDFGPFQVTITDQQIFAVYTIRILSVSVILISVIRLSNINTIQ